MNIFKIIAMKEFKTAKLLVKTTNVQRAFGPRKTRLFTNPIITVIALHDINCFSMTTKTKVRDTVDAMGSTHFSLSLYLIQRWFSKTSIKSTATPKLASQPETWLL